MIIWETEHDMTDLLPWVMLMTERAHLALERNAVLRAYLVFRVGA